MSGLSSHLNFASSKVILALPGFVEYFSVPLKFLDFGRGILPGGIRQYLYRLGIPALPMLVSIVTLIELLRVFVVTIKNKRDEVG